MLSPGSVTRLVELFKSGDTTAAQKLWDVFADRLIALARSRLATVPAVADEEDVVLSALNSFFAGIEEEKFPQLRNREDLWRLLSTMTKRKTASLVKQERTMKRSGGHSQNMTQRRRLSGDEPVVVDPGPAPDLRAVLEDQCQRLLRALGNAQLRSVAIWKMEGFKDEEIAAKLGCTLRTVERKVHLIRKIWGKETMS